MKIAITARGTTLDSEVDPRFGRAKYFIVFDTVSNEFSVQDNSKNKDAVQGAGIQTGRIVADLGVEAVITGNIGPKAFATLQAGHVRIHPVMSGTVKEAIQQFKESELPMTGKANVAGHWMPMER